MGVVELIMGKWKEWLRSLELPRKKVVGCVRAKQRVVVEEK
jgi:hypothetical protein